MPRDRKGKPFGVGDVVQRKDGTTYTVKGFIVIEGHLDRATIERIAESQGATYSDYWHDVEFVKAGNRDVYEREAHTDTCLMDVAQRDGFELPEDRDAIVEAGDKAVSAVAGSRAAAEKAIWGG